MTFCVEYFKVRTDVGMIGTSIVVGDEQVDEVAARLDDAIEVATVTAPDDIRPDFLEARTAGLRVLALLEEASWNLNNLGDATGEVEDLLQEMLDSLVGPIHQWAIDNC